MKSKQTIEVPEETYQELLEIERKYMLLLNYLQSLSHTFGDAKDNLDSFLKKD